MKAGSILIFILLLTDISYTLSHEKRKLEETTNERNLDEICTPSYSSTAFTAIILVYLVLVIAGSILVLIFFKKNLEQ